MNNNENIYLNFALKHLPFLNGSIYEATKLAKVLYAEACVLISTEYDIEYMRERLVEQTQLLNEAIAELSLREK